MIFWRENVFAPLTITITIIKVLTVWVLTHVMIRKHTLEAVLFLEHPLPMVRNEKRKRSFRLKCLISFCYTFLPSWGCRCWWAARPHERCFYSWYFCLRCPSSQWRLQPAGSARERTSGDWRKCVQSTSEKNLKLEQACGQESTFLSRMEKKERKKKRCRNVVY